MLAVVEIHDGLVKSHGNPLRGYSEIYESAYKVVVSYKSKYGEITGVGARITIYFWGLYIFRVNPCSGS